MEILSLRACNGHLNSNDNTSGIKCVKIICQFQMCSRKCSAVTISLNYSTKQGSRAAWPLRNLQNVVY